MRSSSAVPSRHFAPRALRRQEKLSNSSLSFFLQVNRRKEPYAVFVRRVKDRDSSCASSKSEILSINEWGKCWW